MAVKTNGRKRRGFTTLPFFIVFATFIVHTKGNSCTCITNDCFVCPCNDRINCLLDQDCAICQKVNINISISNCTTIQLCLPLLVSSSSINNPNRLSTTAMSRSSVSHSSLLSTHMATTVMSISTVADMLTSVPRRMSSSSKTSSLGVKTVVLQTSSLSSLSSLVTSFTLSYSSSVVSVRPTSIQTSREATVVLPVMSVPSVGSSIVVSSSSSVLVSRSTLLIRPTSVSTQGSRHPTATSDVTKGSGSSDSSDSGGINVVFIIVPIVVVIIVILIAISSYCWYRRRQRLKAAMYEVTAVYYNTDAPRNTGLHFVNDRVFLDREESRRGNSMGKGSLGKHSRRGDERLNGKQSEKKNSLQNNSNEHSIKQIIDPELSSMESTHI